MWYQQRQIIKALPETEEVTSISRREAKECAQKIYVNFHKDLLSMNMKAIEGYASDAVIKELYAKYGRKTLPSHLEPEWIPHSLSVKLVNYVCVQVPPPMNKTYVQATVKITSQQTTRLTNKETGEVVVNDERVPTTDIWVVERLLEDPNAPWFIVRTSLQVN